MPNQILLSGACLCCSSTDSPNVLVYREEDMCRKYYIHNNKKKLCFFSLAINNTFSCKIITLSGKWRCIHFHLLCSSVSDGYKSTSKHYHEMNEWMKLFRGSSGIMVAFRMWYSFCCALQQHSTVFFLLLHCKVLNVWEVWFWIFIWQKQTLEWLWLEHFSSEIYQPDVPEPEIFIRNYCKIGF